jgi:hypothetical protein
LERLVPPIKVAKSLSDDEVGGAERRLRECLDYLDAIGASDIATHVSLAMDRFSDSYLR